MTVTPLGEAILTTRRAQGITQEELAIRIGVTQAALSRYESDMRAPEAVVLAAIASALGVTPKFLHHAGRVHGAIAVDAHMRRRATAKPTVWRQLEAQLNKNRMHAKQLFEEITMHAQQSVPRFDPVDVLPSDAARMVRMQWRMPIGPVRNMTRWLESAGCLIVEQDFGTTRVDGMSQWIDELRILLINDRTPTDRMRMTFAHELGHLCLHAAEVTIDMEVQAEAFAAEFLMPTEVIRPQLRNLTTGRLHDLKREWGVSMQALIEKAYAIGCLTAPQRSRLYKTLSANGWRTREPASDELAAEHAALPASVAETVLGRGLSPDELAHIAGYASDVDNTLFRPARPRLRAV
jgi:Zn-dependent peptidase ImmA (M78 family)/DNA-binding XRE family transcriptional regulator